MPTMAAYLMLVPISSELLEDAAAAERALISAGNPMMSDARVDYWMSHGGYTAFALWRIRISITRHLDQQTR